MDVSFCPYDYAYHANERSDSVYSAATSSLAPSSFTSDIKYIFDSQLQKITSSQEKADIVNQLETQEKNIPERSSNKARHCLVKWSRGPCTPGPTRATGSSRSSSMEGSELPSPPPCSDSYATTFNSFYPGSLNDHATAIAAVSSIHQHDACKAEAAFCSRQEFASCSSTMNGANRRCKIMSAQEELNLRRRTLSPNVFKQLMENYHADGNLVFYGNFKPRYRNYKSIEFLDSERGYETFPGPVQLTPESGKLNENTKALIKPVAFKPISAIKTTASPHLPSQTRPYPGPRPGGARCHSQDEGYASQDYNSHNSHSSCSHSILSQGSSLPRDPYSTAVMANGYLLHNPREVRETPHSSVSKSPYRDCMCTPSPSDSQMEELEVLLREKDSLIQQLRETMEKNETAILQVCEEKERGWQEEIKDLQKHWEKSIQQAAQREVALTGQLRNLQQKNDEDLSHLQGLIEELNWDLAQKSGELSHIKSQLRESKEELASRGNELVTLRTQLKDTQTACEQKDCEILRLEAELKQLPVEQISGECSPLFSDSTLNKLSPSATIPYKSSPIGNVPVPYQKRSPKSPSVEELQQELEKQKKQFEVERQQWLEEKNKVINYQKHLQLNYVQMYRKNKMLEAEIEQLTLELESKESKDESNC